MNAVTTWYLELRNPDQITAKPKPDNLGIAEVEVPQYRFNRFLYELVGSAWNWTDRLAWSDAQWRDYAEAETLHTWVAWHRGSPAGYFELERQDGGDVQIQYFGLAPAFIGMGFGGYLLSHCLESAWSLEGTRRVWVHTCSLDHPGALANYRARGMTLYREETENGE